MRRPSNLTILLIVIIIGLGLFNIIDNHFTNTPFYIHAWIHPLLTKTDWENKTMTFVIQGVLLNKWGDQMIDEYVLLEIYQIHENNETIIGLFRTIVGYTRRPVSVFEKHTFFMINTGPLPHGHYAWRVVRDDIKTRFKPLDVIILPVYDSEVLRHGLRQNN